MKTVRAQALECKAAAPRLAQAGTGAKNRLLLALAEALEGNMATILSANDEDLRTGRESGMSDALLDRLALDEGRIRAMARGVRDVAALEDPVGQVIRGYQAENGLTISQKRVPLGVVGIIFEARPNVTVDAAALCLKSGNATLLRGGKEALRSNLALGKVISETLAAQGFAPESVQVVEDASRQSAEEMMAMTGVLDVLIPRGGRGLIRAVAAQSRVPVIRTGEGVCHIYVDESASIPMAVKILVNAKCSRPSVCNAAECVVVHEKIAPAFWAVAAPELAKRGVELRCDTATLALVPQGTPAAEEDWDSEYGALTLACRMVGDAEEAIAFLNAHTTGHSEAIVTENYTLAMDFLNRIDAAAVYVNASTRFTDGGCFGLGAEIGISTQKLHARGPMGLTELTTSKWCVLGSGQVRE